MMLLKGYNGLCLSPYYLYIRHQIFTLDTIYFELSTTAQHLIWPHDVFITVEQQEVQNRFQEKTSKELQI